MSSKSHPTRAYPGLISMLIGGLLLLAACAETGQMEDQPRYDTLAASQLFADGRSAQSPISNTVPYLGEGVSPDSPALTGLDENGAPYKGFPVPVDQDLVQLGQQRFNIYCIPCHGPSGAGDGKVIPFGFSKPPNLLGSTVKNLTNGEIFQVIENGYGKMFSYGYRVKPNERWAVIAYIRAMQLKNGAVKPADLTPDDLKQIGSHP